jgi:hypothetical protein
MSSCLIAPLPGRTLQHEFRDAVGMVFTQDTKKIWQIVERFLNAPCLAKLPDDMLLRISSYMEPLRVLELGFVSRMFRRIVHEPEERVWRGYYSKEEENPPLMLDYEEQLEAVRKCPLSSEISTLIMQYAYKDTFKRQVLPIQGQLCLNLLEGYRFFEEPSENMQYSHPSRILDWNYFPRWDGVGLEAIAPVYTYFPSGGSVESRRLEHHAFRDQYPEIPSYVLPSGLQTFPYRLPLRFFMNGNGGWKNFGDRISMIWEGRKISLVLVSHARFVDRCRLRTVEGEKVSPVEGMHTHNLLRLPTILFHILDKSNGVQGSSFRRAVSVGRAAASRPIQWHTPDLLSPPPEVLLEWQRSERPSCVEDSSEDESPPSSSSASSASSSTSSASSPATSAKESIAK